jgi:hypothetical protein
MEKRDPQTSLITQSTADASDVWLRFRNNSPLPINFSTLSFYLPRPSCGVKFSNGSNLPGLCDRLEVSVLYEIEVADSRRVPYGLEFFLQLQPSARGPSSVQRATRLPGKWEDDLHQR